MDLIKRDEHYALMMDNLDHLVKVYRTLLEVVRREREILVSAKLEDLTENNKAKDAVLLRIRSLENQRMNCARNLAQEVGADVEAPRLLDIATRFDRGRSDKLRNMHSVLDLLVRRVSEVNKGNEELVRSALRNINGAMDAIRDELQPKPVYEKKGVLSSSKAEAAGNLVRREA